MDKKYVQWFTYMRRPQRCTRCLIYKCKWNADIGVGRSCWDSIRVICGYMYIIYLYIRYIPNREPTLSGAAWSGIKLGFCASEAGKANGLGQTSLTNLKQFGFSTFVYTHLAIQHTYISFFCISFSLSKKKFHIIGCFPLLSTHLYWLYWFACWYICGLRTGSRESFS